MQEALGSSGRAEGQFEFCSDRALDGRKGYGSAMERPSIRAKGLSSPKPAKTRTVLVQRDALVGPYFPRRLNMRTSINEANHMKRCPVLTHPC